MKTHCTCCGDKLSQNEIKAILEALEWSEPFPELFYCTNCSDDLQKISQEDEFPDFSDADPGL
jgi:hypothetical protein